MSYQITQTIDHPSKYVFMVSFNGKPAERYEIELGTEDGKEAAEKIDAILTQAAADQADMLEKQEASKPSVEVADGKIVV